MKECNTNLVGASVHRVCMGLFGLLDLSSLGNSDFYFFENQLFIKTTNGQGKFVQIRGIGLFWKVVIR